LNGINFNFIIFTISKKNTMNLTLIINQPKEPIGIPVPEKQPEIEPFIDPIVPKIFPDENPVENPTIEPTENQPYQLPNPSEFP
jgi:hypothetical protein